MKLIDPTGSPPERDCQMAPRLATLNGLRVGLLSNGKLNADLLLHETAELFRRNQNCEVAKLVYKPNPSAPAPEERIAEVAQDCDFLLTATGD